MDVVKFLKEKYRMTKKCSIGCADCPLGSENNTTGLECGNLQGVHPEIAVSIVEKWSKEHPEETRLTQFLKYYPNAPMVENGTPKMCVNQLGFKRVGNCTARNCIKCWNMPIEE